ncbi:MAG: radical SAM protein [Clostridia bacterium]|nr:radical SAM protein [Clostridia bacterium]
MYNKRLDTYGCGCSHNCSYCYAKSLLNFRKLWNFEKPKVANIKVIERKLQKIEPGTILRLGGMTDCMQPCELKYKNTYKTIQLLNKYKLGYLIVTKSSLIAADEYIKILDPKLAHIQISITSTSDEISKKYEKASLPEQRIKAVEKLQNLGFDVQVRLSPFIEEWIDYKIINKIKCDKILIEFLRVNPFIKKWLDIDYTKYTVKQSNYMHLPLKEKIKMLSNIKKNKEISICEDVTEHYNYWKNNVNFNKRDCCNLRK